MFTIEERDRIRDRLLELGRADARIVAAAFVGSTASGGDRWSDLDISYGIAKGTDLVELIKGWTRQLEGDFDAVHLFDVTSRSTRYRVFLFPGNLQVDLSFTPESDFGPRGPQFELLWGAIVRTEPPSGPQSAERLFGLAVHHLVRARICIERGRLWQAEYWLSSARDQTLTLLCLRAGLRTSDGRGFDELASEDLDDLHNTLIGTLDRPSLFRALDRLVAALLRSPDLVRDLASKLGPQLRELTLNG
jgi:hypothetical protein